MAATGERDGFLVRNEDYSRRLLSALGAHARLYMATLEGEPIAGAIAIQYGDKTWYLYGASSNEHRNAMPNYLLQWEIIRWAIAGGCSLYDFRGVSGDIDPGSPLYGLYRFKKGFCGDFTAFCGTLIRVYRPMAWRCLQAELWVNRLRRRLLRPKRGQQTQKPPPDDPAGVESVRMGLSYSSLMEGAKALYFATLASHASWVSPLARM